jgi:DNA gyrase subunit A
VYGIEVDDATDAVVGMVCINREDKTRTILVVSEKGYGKRTFLDDPETGEANYRVTNRGGKGVKTINVTEKTGSLVGLLDVTEKEDLMITCVSGVTIRMSVASVSEQGRATQGVKLIRVDEGDKIAAITKLDEKEEEIEVTESGIDGAADNTNPATDSTGEDTNPTTETAGD